MTRARTVKMALAGLVAVVALLFTGAVLAQLRLNSFTVYPTSARQSDFFKTYTPEAATGAFDLKKGGSMLGNSGSSARTGSARYSKQADIYFVINAKDRVAVAEAESAAVSEQLQRSGARIVGTDNPVEGRYLIRYVCGHTLGEVVVDPLEIDHKASYRKSLTGDQIPVMARITIREDWFKSNEFFKSVPEEALRPTSD